MKNAEETVYKWYAKSQIDYSTYYIHLYVAYNTWYGQVTGSNNNRRALTLLKSRFMIWRDYINGVAMPLLGVHMQNLIECLKENPLPTHRYWQGGITGNNDWQNLIEYWYQVRCLIVHGEYVPQCHARLAYQTLLCFMTEVVERMHASFSETDMERLQEVTALIKVSKGPRRKYFQTQQQLLQRKYIHSGDIWEVDMQGTLRNPFTNLEKNAII